MRVELWNVGDKQLVDVHHVACAGLSNRMGRCEQA